MISMSKTLAAVAAACAAAILPAHAAEPIRIGAISSISGPLPLPESPAAARAVFDRVNAAGGIQGRRIEYLVQDDKADAGASAQSARDLVDSKGVVAFAGSSSLQDCTTNGNFYRQRKVLSIPGVGGEFTCYRNKNFAPVSVGPARNTLGSLLYTAVELKADKLCAFLLGIPAHTAGNRWAVENFEKISGQKLHLLDTTVLPPDDMTPHVLKAKSAGCTAIVFSGAEQMALAWVKAMKMQGMGDVTLMLMTPAYTANFAAALGRDGDGIYTNSEYEPFLGDSPALADWRKLMADNNIPESSFAQGGYLAATVLVDVLERIEGPITRESVTAALRAIKGGQAITHSMFGDTFSFDENMDTLKVSSTKFVRLKNGKWQVVTPDYYVVNAIQ
ncbi:MAG: ABC transporter substrate-binding protein [Pigmentiphaga sp.]|nr:ABC transporter substrate-binding protein [Pigmentiphaga sp.]